MVVKVCNRCQQWYVVDEQTEDYVHCCGNQGGASEVLKNEDVVVMETNWSDFTGSGTATSINTQGTPNDIWGTRGWLEGGKVSAKTSRGNDEDTHRTRKHEEFIILK